MPGWHVLQPPGFPCMCLWRWLWWAWLLHCLWLLFRLAAWVNRWLSHVKYKKGLHVQHAKTYHTCKYTCIFSKRCIFLFINLCTYLPNNDVNRLRWRHSNSGTRNAVATPPRPASVLHGRFRCVLQDKWISSILHIYIWWPYIYIHLFIYQAPRILNTSSSWSVSYVCAWHLWRQFSFGSCCLLRVSVGGTWNKKRDLASNMCAYVHKCKATDVTHIKAAAGSCWRWRTLCKVPVVGELGSWRKPSFAGAGGGGKGLLDTSPSLKLFQVLESNRLTLLCTTFMP